MRYEIFEPDPSIAQFVRFFWVLEAEVEGGAEFVHRTLADGCVEMVFHYVGRFDEITPAGSLESSPLSSLQAQSTIYRRFSAREDFGIFGVYLYPFAIPRLFGYPAHDLTNISPDLESVFGRAGLELDERVSAASGDRERVGIVTEFLQRKAASQGLPVSPVYAAVHSMINSGGLVDIDGLAHEHSLSRRQFERRFKELAGLPPKLYSRVIRFQRSTQYKTGKKIDLTEIAYSCGYYDQSHFINDFREFSGYTPKEYFWANAEGTQYMEA